MLWLCKAVQPPKEPEELRHLHEFDAEIVSIDPSFTKRGCSVGVKVRCDKIDTLTELLDKKKISYGDIIGRY